MTSASAEQVLVVPTALFHRLGHFQGFRADHEQYLPQLLDPQYTSYLARSEAETDPSFKQLIPYVIFRHRDAQGRQWLFQYTRGKGQGEGRLHSKRSIGIGGHISAEDDRGDQKVPYEVGMRREVNEEVFIGCPYTEQRVGLINDDETEVGRVHLGIVHVFDVEQPAVQPRETDLLETSFRPVEELLDEIEHFETWSQICLKALFA